MRQIICQAIQKRRTLSFTYNGKSRRVEPHLLGYDADGDLTLSAWQFSGTSQGWRDFHVSKVSTLLIEQATFAGARPDYSPKDASIERVVCRL